jgi:hypothetical protein
VRRTPYQLCKEFLSIYCIKKFGDSAKLSVKKISGAMLVAVADNSLLFCNVP